MKKYLIIPLILLKTQTVSADLWGNDIPLLIQIVSNTLRTLQELGRQTSLMRDELRGINDRIYRIRTIANIVHPSSWNEWKDPHEALKRLQRIYYTLPKEYRTEKSDEIEREISKALSMLGRLHSESTTTFRSGKELERKGARASPGVAQKLTASGVGSLIALEAQSQVLQGQAISLLSKMLANANEKESRALVSRGKSYSGFSENLGTHDGLFSSHIAPMRIEQ